MRKKKNQTERPLLIRRVWLFFALLVTTFSMMASGREHTLTDGIRNTQQSGTTITGVVTDNKEPIIGASVLVKENQTGTITDFDGNFTLHNVPAGATIQVSYIGYLTQEVKLGSERHLLIVLREDSQTLDEVIVVGYGTQKKANLTGAVGQVDSKIIESRPVMNAAAALQGAIPNLQILPSSGDPAASATLNIRGTTSINGGGPLVLVDGLEMSLDMVNPNDIANVTVLKDAAAAAIYGVRAAFGVVLVTTKSGTTDKTTISYSGSVAFSQATRLPDMVDTSWEHAEFINTAIKNASGTPFDLAHIDKMKAYDKDPKNNPEYDIVDGKFYFYGYTDWVGRMLKKFTPSQRHNVNISGGNDKTKFYSSIGYLNQEGIYKYGDDNFKRLNTRLTVENQTTSWLKLGAKVLYNYSNNSEPVNYKDNIFSMMVFSVPTNMADPFPGVAGYPEYDKYIGTYFDDQNAIAYLDIGGRKNTMKHDVWLTGSADLTFTKNWKARVDFTYNLNYTNIAENKKRMDMMTNLFNPSQGSTSTNYYERRNNNKDYYSFNVYTEYENTFAGKHYLKAMMGYNQELTKYNYFWGRRYDGLIPDLPSLSLGTGQHEVAESGYEWALRGAFFRLNYIYDSRYLFEINGRYDGTSRFPSDDRFVFLPSFSAAWRISEEAFMNSTRGWLDNLKLRASYGVLGNQLLTDTSWTENRKYYPYIPFMPSGTGSNWLFNSNGKSPYINPAYLVTEDLTWEKASTINAGVDLTLLDQRLDMSFDWYQRTTSDMLMMKKYPGILGATAPPVNGATLRTRGWEFILKWNDRIGKDFTYGVTLMLADSQAEITKYENESGAIDDYYVGKKYGDIWGYETDRLFTRDDFDITIDDNGTEIYKLKENIPNQNRINSNWSPGDVKYKNLDDDDTAITDGSRTLDDHGDLRVIGNTTPRYQYGITANVAYKNIWASVFFQGVGKRDFYPESQQWWPAPTQYYNTQKWFMRDSWSEDNPDAYFYKPTIGATKNREKQTRYLQDASYLRLKNLTIGYNIPRVWLNRIGLSQASVYVSGENLLTFTPLKGALDPEAAEKKGEMVYPFQRTYSIGINVTF
ncbi:MAG: TonB-dependent receptor [Bacteroides sp.]|nr:TonB-dependent receptor [Bacteroides sp.]